MKTDINSLRNQIKLVLIALAAMVLSACNSGNNDQQNINGEAVKGIISDGIVKVYKLDDLDTPIADTRTNELGQFTFQSNDIPDAQGNLYFELSVDQQTRMSCDVPEGCYESISGITVPFGEQVRLPAYFKLFGIGLADKAEVHISPLSHVIVSTAKSLEGGLNIDNINTANQWLQQALALDFDPFNTETADLTALSDTSNHLSELQQAVLSASLYENAITTDWSTIGLPLEEISISELAQVAATLANQIIENENSDTSTTENLQVISQSATSLAASLSDKSLSIHNQPSSTTVEESESLALFVNASGEGELQYQWYKDDEPIAGAITSTFSIASTNEADAGIYNVIITDDNESLSSLYALVSVTAKPLPATITQHPASLSVNEGDTITLSIEAAGEAPLHYQWQKGGSIIPGATDSTLVIENSQLSDAGTYRVTVTNNINSVDSNFANVGVNEEAHPPSITQHPQSITVVEGTPLSISVEASGTGFLNYQWQKDGNAISGAYSNIFEISTASLSDQGSYQVYVSNSQGSILSLPAEVNVLPNAIPVSITQQPLDQTGYVNQSFTLTVMTNSDDNISYQWYKDEQAISNATNNAYTVESAALEDTGIYHVVVSNDVNQVTSNFATVSISALPSVELSWTSPTQRADQTTLQTSEIHGYVVEYGYSSNNLSSRITIDNPNANSLILDDLTPGTLYVRIATVDIAYQQSSFSDIIAIQL